MAVEVRIPTILRTYTGGAKAVDGAGRHAGRGDRQRRVRTPRASRSASSRAQTCAASSTSTSTTRTSASSTVSAHRSATAMSSSCCLRSPAADHRIHAGYALRLTARIHRWYAADRPAGVVAVGRRSALGQARRPQSDRLDQGPRSARDARRGREGRHAAALTARSSSRRRATPGSRWRWRASCAAIAWSA